MEVIENPFYSIEYRGKDYFCDRKEELKRMRGFVENGFNMTLISLRRLGKSALIHRFFEDMEQENSACIYVDIYATTCLKDFTETLALAIFAKFPQKRGIGRRFLDFLKGFRPIITYDSLTGAPEVHFEYVQPQEYEHTLRSLFLFLDSQDIKVVLAIDEFQQVADYPEKNAEALLRTIIQTLKNIRLIFSGSKKHLMLEMFNTANRPFFAGTQIIGLGEIPEAEYKAFIHKKFNERKRTIDDDAVDFILSWTFSHTYYTQVICNGAFASRAKRVTIAVVKHVCEEQLNLQQVTYMQYKSLLSPIQWQLLIAIAKEGLVSEPQAQAFLRKYKIGAASSSRKALNALLDKEMIFSIESSGKTTYRVYNVFLLRWLERTFRY